MLIPFFRIAEISIGEVVSFDDESHDLLCPRDHVGIGKEPQFPDKRVKVDDFDGSSSSWVRASVNNFEASSMNSP